MTESPKDVSISPVGLPPAESKGEGCPTPLAWQEVVQAFRNESEVWRIERGDRFVDGRSWGSGPPLYFLNGMGGTSELFALFGYLLREEFRCVFFDTVPPRARDSETVLRELAADVSVIADQLGDRRVSLFATSFGGLVALQALATEPDRFDRAVLQGAFARRQLSLAERALLQVARLLSRPLRELPWRERIQEQNHRTWFPPFDQGRWQFFLENTGEVSVDVLVRRAAVIRDVDLRPLLPRIAQPILLIRGEGEGLVSTQSHDELRNGLPNVQEEVMHTTGHLPYLTHPHRLAKLVKPFLRGEPVAAS